SGDRVVASTASALAVFHVDGSSISVEQLLDLDAGSFPQGVQEPRFRDETTNTVFAVAETPPTVGASATNFLVSCDRAARTCRRGDPAPATEWIRPVRSDRPTKGGR